MPGKQNRGYPPSRGVVSFLLFTLSIFAMFSVQAVGRTDLEMIPHVSASAQESFNSSYRYATNNKAYAIAPGGAWSWGSEAVTPEDAKDSALQNCQKNTQQKCMLYALNNSVVFDKDRWSRLWGPYLDSKEALKRKVGHQIGERFPNLSFSSGSGKNLNISDFQNRVTLVHFWGSWCPPCMREFPSLQKLTTELGKELKGKVAVVLLQVREPYSVSMQWARKNGFDHLPLYNSGHAGSEDHTLVLADKTLLEDRTLAATFPSSYVIDKNGIILFKHRGPIRDWSEYIPFFRDATESE